MIEIRVIDALHKADIRLPNEPFELFGRIVPTYDGTKWAYELIRFAPGDVAQMCFPDENYDYDAMPERISWRLRQRSVRRAGDPSAGIF